MMCLCCDAMVNFCLPNKSHKLLLCLMYSNILNAIVSFIFFSTEEDLTLAMEMAPNVIESQQTKIPEVLNVTGNITAHGQMNMMPSSVSAPGAGRKALCGEQKPVQDGGCAAEGFLELLP